MNCRELDVLAYVKGTLSEDDKARTKSHIAYCAACTTDVERTRGLLRLLQTEEWVQPSPAFFNKVMSRYDAGVAPQVEEEQPTTLFREILLALLGRSKRSSLTWGVSLSIHAILFGVLTIFVFTQTRTPDDDLVLLGTPPAPEVPKAPDPGSKRIEIPNTTTGGGKILPPSELEGAWPKVEGERKSNIDDDLPIVTRKPRPVPEEEPRKIYNDWMYEQRDMMGAVNDYRKDRKARDTKLDPQGRYHDAVEKSLTWLAKQQDKSGKWAWKPGAFNQDYELGVTAISLLSFMADGNSSTAGAHKETVRRGIDYIVKSQDVQDGHFGEKHGNWLYNHVVATAAVLEDFVMTQDKDLRMACNRALLFLAKAQNQFGGWAYDVNQPESDMHVTTWAILTLRMAMTAGFRDLAVVPLMQAKALIPTMLLPNEHYAYRPNVAGQFFWQGPTAMGMLAHTFTTFAPDRPMLEKQAAMLDKELMLDLTPGEHKSNNLMAIYFTGLVTFQLQDAPWESFWKKYPPLLVSAQEKSGAWPVGIENPTIAQLGGQYYVTAISALILQTYNRYPPVH